MEIRLVSDFVLCPPPITITGQSPVEEVHIHSPLLRLLPGAGEGVQQKLFFHGGNPKTPKPYNFLKFQSLQLAEDDVLKMRFDSMC